MPMQTGKFDNLGVSYEEGSNAALLSAIARSAEELTSGKGWPDGVNDLLAALGRVTGVSRVWIFQTVEVSPAHITQNYTFEWASDPKYVQIGMSMFSMFTVTIDQPEYRSLIESRQRGEWQKVIVSQLERGYLHENLSTQKIKSMLTIPIMVDDEWWGTLGFDDCEREYDWNDVEIALLRTAGYLISNAVLRDRLSAKRKQFGILRQITDSSAWAYDFKTGQVWCAAELIHTVPMPMENYNLSLRSAIRLVHPVDRGPLFREIRDYMASRKNVFRHDLRVFTDCGDLRWVELIGNLRRNDRGQPEQFAGIAVDIRARKQEEDRLREEAVTDPLTGVLNRRMFWRELQKHVDGAIDQGDSFAVLILDIDHFKILNDTHGHAVGDGVLRQFTERCVGAVRGQDVVARLGGDEFVILLPGEGGASARAVGERILHSVGASPFAVLGQRLTVTTSIGLYVHDGALTTPARIVESADFALYRAKHDGRNRLAVASCCQTSI
ncbi:diguanylate cyclase [Pseudodesulfovibrio sp. S3]|nr:diguanylate cyclase [Pseudodesulfovibrio sp. S3]